MNSPARKAETPSNPKASDLNEAMEHTIDAMTRLSTLSPATKVTFDGSYFQHRPVADEDGQFLGHEFRRTDTPPLEALLQARSPIEPYQYLAGVRFRLDWTASQIGPLASVDYARAAQYATEEVLKAGKWDGAMGGKILRGVAGISDAKLDASARLGRVAKEINKLSFWLARKVIGEEWTIVQCAGELGRDQRYVGPRFREALDELAFHYKMIARGRG